MRTLPAVLRSTKAVEVRRQDQRCPLPARGLEARRDGPGGAGACQESAEVLRHRAFP